MEESKLKGIRERVGPEEASAEEDSMSKDFGGKGEEKDSMVAGEVVGAENCFSR